MQRSERMNIILIVSDTFRYDHIGANGNPAIRTPHLDAFAAQSVNFDNAYVGSFPTVPHRTDLLTGHYVYQNRGWSPLPNGEATLATILGSQGYVNQMVVDHVQLFAPGMNFHQGFHGWQAIRGQAGEPYITDPVPVELPCAPEKIRMPEKALAYLKNVYYRTHERDHFVAQTFSQAADWLERNYTHENFFLYIDTFTPHEPWDPPQHYTDMYDPGYEGEKIFWPRYDRIDYLTEPELKHAQALYAGSVSLVDTWFGHFIERVKHLGLWDDTMIVFNADHGFYIGEHGYIGKHTVLEPKQGWPLYREVSQVPLLVHVPGIAPRRTNALVQAIDVMPTVLEMAGAQVPDGLHSDSLLPVLRGDSDTHRDAVVSSPLLPLEEDVLLYSTINDGQWTLMDPGNRGIETAELYNLAEDPSEERNVIADHPEVAQRLHARYLEEVSALGTENARYQLRKWPSDA
jgi:arylsulfatase A-like enzyme